VLAPAEGLSPALFLVIGPILFGVVTAVASLAVAGALRLPPAVRTGAVEPERPEPAQPGSPQ
jgi:hypothetical protein